MRMFVNGVDVGGTTPRPTLLNNNEDVSIGSRRMSNGAYDLNFDGKIDEVAFFNRALSAAEVAQHYNAAFAGSPTETDITDAVFAAELIATQTLPTITARSFVFNEVSTGGVELMNLGAAATPSGLTVVRVTSTGSVSNVVASQNVEANGLFQIPLSLSAGDRVLLLAPDGLTVLDSFAVKSTPRGRSPDGTGRWFRPVSVTPGAVNSVMLQSDVVINEIMFDPPTDAYFAAGTARADQWIELYNKNSAPVDLGGWTLSGAVGFMPFRSARRSRRAATWSSRAIRQR